MSHPRPISDEAKARIGETVGGAYRITGVLGEGGFGAVFEAVDLGSGEQVAVKCLHPELTKHHESLTRFRREAAAAAKIGHPGIVRVFGSGQDDDGTAWIAMERLHGRDARQLAAEDAPVTVGRATRLARKVCDALQAAHDAQIVHRDLKLDNVWVGEDDTITLLDFGVSKFQDVVDGATLMTRTGVAMGSPYSMAPEQAQGKKSVDHRVDIYAVGVMLFRLLTGQHPFEDSSYPILVVKICTEPTPPIEDFRGDVPLAFARVVERCLRKAPDDRFSSAKELADALMPFEGVETEPDLREGVRLADQGPAALTGHSETLPVDSKTGAPIRSDLDDGAQDAAKAMTGTPSWLMPLALAGVVLVAVVIGLAATGGSDEVVTPPPANRLPAPGQPVIRAMQVPDTGELTWRWINPRPRAMPPWNDVEVAGPGAIAMVGREGRAARLNGSSLSAWATGTQANLHGVAFLGPAQAIAVGDDGTALALLQDQAVVIETGTTEHLRDVAALGTVDAVVVGGSGTIIRLRGLRPEPVDTGREETFFGVVSRGETLYAAGERGIIVRVDEQGVVVEHPPEGATLRAIGGCRDELYAVGDNGTVLKRAGEGHWSRMRVDSDERWTGVACDAGRAAASGSEGSVLLLAGEQSVLLSSGSDQAFNSIGGAPGARSVLVGSGGRLAAVDDNHLVLLSDGPSGTLFDIAELGGALVGIGQWGTIARWDGRRIVPAQSPTDAALSAMALLSEDRLIAVGDHGALVEIRWDVAELLEGPPQSGSWRDVVAGGGALLAVGSGGTLLRGTPGALVVSRADVEGTLWTVSGIPEDAVAAGDAGAVLHVGNEGWSPLDCPPGGALHGSFVDETGATWLVGAEGRVLKVEGRECVEVRPATDDAGTLWAVELGVRGTPLAVGEDGLMLEWSTEGDTAGSFVAVDSGTRMNLRAIHRTEREVFVSGAGGTILRHARLDRH